MKRKISLILAILWMAFIFYMSNQPSTVSSAQSSGFIEYTSNLPLIGNIISKLVDINIATIVVRKSAHMFSYFLLCILIFISIYNQNQNGKCLLISFIISVIYACTDEFHQLFIPGRSGEIKDIIIDSMGALISIIIINIFVKSKKR